MNEVLAKRLRDHARHVMPGYPNDLCSEAADAIEAKDAEIERLRIAAGDAREKSTTSYLRAVESRTAWRARAEQAEAEIARLKDALGDPDGTIAHADAIESRAEQAERALAEAVEVLRPFTGATLTDDGQIIGLMREHFAAARQFIKGHGE